MCIQDHDRPGGRPALQRHGGRRLDGQHAPQAEAPRRLARAYLGLEEGCRAACARRQDRILRGQVMGIKRFKPTSPGRRFMTVDTFEDITRSEPERSLMAPLKKNGGRNNYGRITTRHKGGGHKRRYRVIDFKRDKDGVPAKVAHIEYDPNRSARIALLHYADGEKRYILAPQKLEVGDTVMSGTGADIKPGNALKVADIPTGTVVHAIELQPGRGAAMARSAGTSAQLMAKEGDKAILRMPSTEMRMVRLECRATVGVVGNAEHCLLY